MLPQGRSPHIMAWLILQHRPCESKQRTWRPCAWRRPSQLPPEEAQLPQHQRQGACEHPTSCCVATCGRGSDRARTFYRMRTQLACFEVFSGKSGLLLNVVAHAARPAVLGANHRSQKSVSRKRSTGYSAPCPCAIMGGPPSSFQVRSGRLQTPGRPMVTLHGTIRRRYPAIHVGSTSSGGEPTNSSCGRYCTLYAIEGQPAIQYPR
jgi:hypothetical protein